MIRRNKCLTLLALWWAVDTVGPVMAESPRLDPRCRELPEGVTWPLLRRNRTSLLKVADQKTYVSTDEGLNWSLLSPVFPEGQKHVIREALLITLWPDPEKGGRILLVFTNQPDSPSTGINPYDRPLQNPALWVIRSDDGGQTWTHLQKIADGSFFSLRSTLLTPGDVLSVAVQEWRDEPGRFVARSYYTANQGVNWRPSNFIDLGGHGREDGAMDPAIVELRNGRLWMLIRTNLGRFWSAYSDEQGMSWRTIKPSAIEASSSPGFIKRLTSDRLVLLWNRLYPEGQTDYPKIGEPYTATPASWQREELSIAFSDDDGQTWSKPAILARRPMQGMSGLAYPTVFEVKPGELWIFTRQGDLRVAIHEADFVGKP